MAHSLRAQGAAEIFGTQAPEVGKSFAQDRSAMRVAVPRVGANDAAGACQSYLRRLANMLEEHPYLLGALPCVADFAAYHPLWFMRVQTPAMARLLDATPAVLAWSSLGLAQDEGDPDHLLLGSTTGIPENGRLFETVDGGVTWQESQPDVEPYGLAVAGDVALMGGFSEGGIRRREGDGPWTTALESRVGFREFVQDPTDPDRWVAVDGSGTVDEVAERVSTAITARLPGGALPL